MTSTYVDTRLANVGNIRCLFALASDSTSLHTDIPRNVCRESVNLLKKD